MQFEDSRDFAARLDAADPIAKYREQFNFPPVRGGRRPVYLVGNSLGLQPKLAALYVEQEMQKWKDYGVEGFFHAERPWLNSARQCAAGFAELTRALVQQF